MIINNYNINCDYHSNGYKDRLIIQPFDENIDYKIDDSGKPICTNVSGSLSAITCYEVQYQEESSFDDRFEFASELKITLYEHYDSPNIELLEFLKEGKFRLIIEDKNGVYWLLNAEKEYTFSFENNISNSDDACTVTFSLYQNVPSMLIQDFSYDIEKINDNCSYVKNNITFFNIIESDSLKLNYDSDGISYNSITVIGDKNWFEVVPLKGSFAYKQTYSDNVYYDEIKFNISLSDYLSTFHYNLIEFTKNRYTVYFKSSFNHIVKDLFPSFQISENVITITLSNSSHSHARIIESDIEIDRDETVKPSGDISDIEIFDDIEYNTTECIAPNTEKRLLFPQVDKSGKKTGKYYVLDGYQLYYFDIINSDKFAGIITEEDVENLDFSIYIESDKCNSTQCNLTTSLENINYIYDNTITATFKTNCEGTIHTNSDYLIVSSNEILPDVDNEITIISNLAYDVEGKIIVNIDNIDYEYIIIRKELSCFIADNEIDVDARANNYTFKLVNVTTNNIMYNILDKQYLKFNGDSITVKLPMNTSKTEVKVYNFDFINLLDSEHCSIIINQDHIYVDYIDDGFSFICEGYDKYHKLTEYSGYTSDAIDTETGVVIKGELWEADSYDCGGGELVLEEWREDPTEYICDDEFTKWHKEYLWSGHTYEEMTKTETSRKGNLWERNSTDCGYIQELERWSFVDEVCGLDIPSPENTEVVENPIVSSVTSETMICQGYDYVKQTDIETYIGLSEEDLILVDTNTIYQLIEENSTHCGYTPPEVIYSSLTESYDDGCQGYTWLKGDIVHYYSGYSQDSLVEYNTITVEQNEPNSEHCGYVPFEPIYDWEYKGEVCGYDVPEGAYEKPQPTGQCETIVTWNDGTTSAYTLEKIPYGWMGAHINVASVIIGTCVTSIGYSAFEGCSGLTSVIIPDSVTSIGNNAFYECYSISSVKIGSGITKFGEAVFCKCRSIPSIIIPNGVTYLSSFLFESCVNLQTITIPNSVVFFEMAALQRCIKLTSIIYKGTISQWKAIRKSSTWRTDVPSTCVVHCTDGDIPISESYT